MNVNTEGGLDLTESETHALALRVVARQIARQDDWLQWEDVPALSEGAFNALDAVVIQLADDAYQRSAAFDRASDIDSIELLEETQ